MREASGRPGPAAERRAGRRLVFGFAAFAAALFLLTRLALLALRDDALGSDPWAVARALAAGVAYDLLILLWLSVPLALYLALIPARWFGTRLQRALLWTGIAAASYGLLFVAAAECVFFDEFESRYNFVAVDYLVYPHEVVANIWQSYPTAWILAGLVSPACGVALDIRRAVGAALLEARRARTALLFSILVACAALTSAVSPAWGNVSSDRALNEVSRNGIYTFFAALRGSQASFEGLYRTLPEREVFQRLSGLLAESSVAPGSFESGSTLRRIDNAGPERRSNVVVVLEESRRGRRDDTLARRARGAAPALLRASAGPRRLLARRRLPPAVEPSARSLREPVRRRGALPGAGARPNPARARGGESQLGPRADVVSLALRGDPDLAFAYAYPQRFGSRPGGRNQSDFELRPQVGHLAERRRHGELGSLPGRGPARRTRARSSGRSSGGRDLRNHIIGSEAIRS